MEVVRDSGDGFCDSRVTATQGFPYLERASQVIMNSPDPGSPISTESSGPPSRDEISTQPITASSQFMNIAAQFTQSLVGGSKRRLPGSSNFGGPSSNRDAKTRRRGEPGRHGGHGGPSMTWDTGARPEGKREDRELVDNHIVDLLRKGTFSLMDALTGH
jgi:hypothetical protein